MNPYAEAGVSYDDYSRMQTGDHAPARRRCWTPEWAASDKTMRHVLAQRCWAYSGRYCNRNKTRSVLVPNSLVNDHAALNKRVNDLVAKCNWKNVHGAQLAIHQEHLAAIKSAGSYLALQCAVLYRAYRLGENSTTIGEGLGISPAVVRQILARCNDAARLLGYECCARHWSTGSKRPHKMRVREKEKGRTFRPGPRNSLLKAC
jgi:hypothetical protein